MLESECRAAGVQIFLESKIREVQRTTEFVVQHANRPSFVRRHWSSLPADFPFPKSAPPLLATIWRANSD